MTGPGRAAPTPAADRRQAPTPAARASAQNARRAPTPAASAPPALAALQRLQGQAGNAAVARLLAQRAAPAPGLVRLQRLDVQDRPVAPPGRAPMEEPAFKAVAADVKAKGRAVGRHPGPQAPAKAAADAALAPSDDKEAQAKAARVGEMGAAKPGTFDKAAFIAAVNKAIDAQAPKTLGEADEFATSGKADAVKGAVAGQVTAGKASSAQDITEKTAAPPDPSKAVDKPVTPLPPQPATPVPARPDPKAAAVPPAPAEQTDLSGTPKRTDDQMAEAKVTPEQLGKANEPEFAEALTAKQAADAHAATAPGAYREVEAAKVAAEQGGAAALGTAGMQGLAGAKTSAGAKVGGGQGAAKSKDEQARAAVSAEIKASFDATKTETEKILGDLDGEVDAAFDAGQARAKAAFTADHTARMAAYKDARYSGIGGGLQWLADLVLDLPPEADEIFLRSRKVYEAEMQKVVGEIADTIGKRLGEATTRIARGRADVAAIVARQGPQLRQFAQQAAEQFSADFDQLDASVNDKSEGLVDSLAQRYAAARGELDDEIKELQAQNKGLLSKAEDAIAGTIRTILQLKDMLLGVLARAAGAIEKIVTDPIGFLGHLVDAVKEGVTGFATRIGDHLKTGLKEWLFGQLAAGGVEIPDEFDAKGVIKLVLSVLGLTWDRIRARAVAAIGEPAMQALESTFEMVKVLITEGAAGMWRWIVEKLSDIKDTVIGAIEDFVTEKIVTAGITWIVSLLNPASAFVRACKAIYDVVMFFVGRASQIKSFVDSVLDSVEAIAGGGAGGVPALIEASLAKAVPVVLDFLASLLGLGGIGEKIRNILEKVQAPVMKVVDWVLAKIVAAGKQILAKLRGKSGAGADAAGGPETADSTRVKHEAHSRLLAAWPSVRNEAELFAAAAKVETDLRGEGLKRLRVVKSNRGYDFLMTASPETPEGGVDLTPVEGASDKDGGEQSRGVPGFKQTPGDGSLGDLATVRCSAEVEFEKAPAFKEKFGRHWTRETGEWAPAPAAIEGRGNKRDQGTSIGGQIFPMAEGEKVARVHTWNTRAPDGSHASHAENQLANWLTNSVDPGAKVLRVSLKVVGRGPCPGCTAELQRLLATLRQRAGAKTTVQAVISYSAKEHTGWEGTGTNAEESLKASGWTVEGRPAKAKVK